MRFFDQHFDIVLISAVLGAGIVLIYDCFCFVFVVSVIVESCYRWVLVEWVVVHGHGGNTWINQDQRRLKVILNQIKWYFCDELIADCY